MRMNNLLMLLAALLAGALLTGALAVRADDAIKTVYHLPDDRLATLALNNVTNHLTADPGVKIVVVALSTGVRAFTFGAQLGRVAKMQCMHAGIAAGFDVAQTVVDE